MPKKPQISILGCGWLGLPLAVHLIEKGYAVKGATTRPEKIDMLREKNIEPFLIRLNPAINPDYSPSFFDSEVLVVNIPPGRSRADVAAYHVSQIRSLIAAMQQSSVSKVLFVSATSVYPDVNKIVWEEDAGSAVRESGEALLQAEKILGENPCFTTTIVRLGGLFGGNRNPGRFLSGKILNNNGEAPVNLIHRDDCVSILSEIIVQERWGEIYNACADAHPSKKEFYTAAAQKLGIAPPLFAGKEKGNYKIINSDKLKKELGYRFKHRDPLQAL